MIRRPPRSTQSRSSAASDVYKRQQQRHWQAPDVAEQRLAQRGLVQRRSRMVHREDVLTRVRPTKTPVDAADSCARQIAAQGMTSKSCLLYTSDAADDLL